MGRRGGGTAIPQPDKACRIGGGEIHRQDLSAAYGAEFLDGVNEQGAAVNAKPQSTEIDDTIEREIAEAIFDWWISKKSYKQWYADKYLQQKLDFNETNE
jgi:hypothetical protein